MNKFKALQFIILAAFLLHVPFLSVHAEDLKTSINEYRKFKKNVPTVTPLAETDPAFANTSLDYKKQQLTKIISMLIQVKNTQKDHLSSLTILSQLQKDQLSQLTQSSIGDLMAKAAKIDAIQAQDKLKILSTDVLDAWNSSQIQYKKNLLIMLNAQLVSITGYFELEIQKLSKEHEALVKDNKDVTLLQTKISDCQNNLNTAKSQSEQISTKLNSLNKESNYENDSKEILGFANQALSSFQAIKQCNFDAKAEINRLNKNKK